jgi:hypothetical protein
MIDSVKAKELIAGRALELRESTTLPEKRCAISFLVWE